MNSKFFKKALCLIAFFGISNNISIAMENSADGLFESNFTFGKKGLNNYSKSKSDNINEYDLNGFYDVGEEAGNNVHNLQKQIFGMQQKTYELKDKFDKICKSDDCEQMKEIFIYLKKEKKNHYNLINRFNRYQTEIEEQMNLLLNNKKKENKENIEKKIKELTQEIDKFNDNKQHNKKILNETNDILNEIQENIKNVIQQKTNKLYYDIKELNKEFYLKYNKPYEMVEKYIKEAKKLIGNYKNHNEKQKEIRELINNVQNYIQNSNKEQIAQLGKNILEILNYNANFSDRKLYNVSKHLESKYREEEEKRIKQDEEELHNVLKYLVEEKNRLKEDSKEYSNEKGYSIINKKLKEFIELNEEIVKKTEDIFYDDYK